MQTLSQMHGVMNLAEWFAEIIRLFDLAGKLQVSNWQRIGRVANDWIGMIPGLNIEFLFDLVCFLYP